MTVKTEGRHAAEFVLSEGPGQISRGNITIGASQTIVPGAVLGKADEGHYKVLAPGASDGTETAAAIALYGVVTGAEETAKIAAIVDLAEVNGKLLTWPAGITNEQKAAAIVALAARNIKVR